MILPQYTIESFDFQARAFEECYQKLALESKNTLLIGATGVGKTYVIGQLLHKMFTEGLFDNSKAPFPVLYVTDNSVVPQTSEDLFATFNIPCNKVFVTNYAQLRATIGSAFINWVQVGKKPEWDPTINAFKQVPDIKPFWILNRMPQLIIADEWHKVKNEGTLQHLVMENYILQGGRILMAGATPFTRVSEGKLTSLAIKPMFRGPEDTKAWPLTHNRWPAFAQSISGSASDIHDYNSAAVDRLREALESNIVRITGVKFKKRTLTHCRLIDFESQADKIEFSKSYDEYLAKLAKINKDAPGGIAELWVAQTMFRKKAEWIRAPYLAKIGKEIAEGKGKQIIFGSNYVGTLTRIRKTLINLGVPEDRISIIVGGQSKKERQANIAKFQTGKADYCLLTLKSGGTGLSLHHYKKNAKVCKPRYVILPPTWSAIEIVQVLGRGHRINSISTTYQDIVWFRGTVEEEVSQKLERKLGCLGELVGKKETWTGTFSRRSEFDSINELKELELKEVQETDDDGDVAEVIEADAYSNPENDGELVEV